MGSTEVATKPHAVCIPLPVQSHMKAMLKFAKLLHHRGFHITFVNTEFNHKRFLKSLGPNSLDGLPDFRFEAFPDSLPDSNEDTTQDGTLLCESIRNIFLAPLHALLAKLNNDAIETSSNPPMTCIVSDGLMSTFTITAVEKIGAPIVLFYTIAACSFMGIKQFRAVVEKGLAPLNY
ncbi:7-deoxyloganetin glucosyltransferase-like isoform X4 [Prunus yedoensis var. nudiflora]|uniref:7-deoxyloganetin glucosyltransferase-like isoform X4 n=1 Tax=Prunus yedoensis var. nudiflora TaxID=2094558 RepID=A0A314YKQ5_PRUYE|nr:7-deoxyloganetin glucosyltransferase-like isoform X4 [Prunus yedoensis var. nudiflora]